MRTSPLLLTSLATTAALGLAATGAAVAAADDDGSSSRRDKLHTLEVAITRAPPSQQCTASGVCVGTNGGGGPAFDSAGRQVGTSIGTLSFASNPTAAFGTTSGFSVFELQEGPCGAGTFVVRADAPPGETAVTGKLVQGGGLGGYDDAKGTAEAKLVASPDGSLRATWTLRIRCR